MHRSGGVRLVNDLLVNVAAELIAEAVVAGTQLAARRRDQYVSEQIRLAWDEVQAVVKTQFADHVQRWPEAGDHGALSALLGSKDLHEFALLRVAAQRADLDQAANATFRQMLLSISETHLGDDEAERLSPHILDALDSAIGSALSKPGLTELLQFNHEEVAYHLIVRQLDSLVEAASFRSRFSSDDEARLRKKLRKHQQQIRDHTSRVSPPDFSERRLVPLEDIYVLPTMTGRNDGPGDLLTRLKSRELGGVVVLGDPGAGKTTLSTYLVNALTDPSSKHDLATAVIVPLTDYEAKRENGAMSVAEYLAGRSRERLHVDITAAEWSDAFRLGIVAVFFDGLDELVQVPRRVDMADIIDSFVSAFPNVPTIITCRFQGYSEAALPREHFDILRLQPFSPQQVEEYVLKWFSLENNSITNLTAVESTTLFLQESNSTRELRTNPLLLSLLCILFRGRGYIPENLAEVYRECSELLFERWDRHRQVRVASFGDRLRHLLERLAWWMYSDGLNEVGVPEQKLLVRCTKELLVLKAADTDAARAMAEEFIEHCRGRAWVFSDASVSDNRERRFCFTHRSFMEYFAARRLARDLQRRPDEAGAELDELIFVESGEFMAVLALQVLGEDADDALTRFIDRLERRGNTQRDAAVEFLMLALRYVDVHDSVAYRICELVVEEVMPEPSYTSSPMSDMVYLSVDEASASAADVVARLFDVRSENLPAVARFFDSAPVEVSGDWNVVPAIVNRLSLANLAERAAPDSAITILRRRDQSLRERLHGWASNLDAYAPAVARLVALELLPLGLAGEKWASDLLQEHLGSEAYGQELTALQVAAWDLLVNQKVSHSLELAERVLTEVVYAAGVGAPIVVRASDVRRVLSEIDESFTDPVDVFRLLGEDYLFEGYDELIMLAALMILLRAAELLDHPAAKYLRASLVRSVSGTSAENAYLKGLDIDADPLLKVRPGEELAAFVPVLRQLREVVQVESDDGS